MTSPTPVHRLVLTGGPCGGKTTALNRLRNHFQSLGWRVFLVPDTATLVSDGGVNRRVARQGQPPEQPDPARCPVKKCRCCLLHENLYFERDDHNEPAVGLHILQVEVNTEKELRLPRSSNPNAREQTIPITRR